MMIPLTRASGKLALTFAERLAPSVVALRSHLPASEKLNRLKAVQDTAPPASCAKISRTGQSTLTASSTHSIPALSAVFGLYGMTNTKKLIGPTVLRYVISMGPNGACAGQKFGRCISQGLGWRTRENGMSRWAR